MRQRLSQRGSAILFAMAFMVVLLIITAAVGSAVRNQLRASGIAQQRVTAEYVAETGISQAIAWFAARSYVMPQASDLTTTVPVYFTTTPVAYRTPVMLPNNHPDSYTDATGTKQTGVVSGTSGTTQGYKAYLTSQKVKGFTYNVAATLVSQSPEVWEVLSTAKSDSIQRQAGAIIYRATNPGIFDRGLFGDTSVTLRNNAGTNSYDSTKGAATGSNLLGRGNVGSNGTVTLNNNATVNGNAIAGPGLTPSLANNSKVTGSIGSETTPRPMPTIPPTPTLPSAPVVVPTAACNTTSYTSMMNPAVYHFSSINCGNNATITIGATNVTTYLVVDNGISLGNNATMNLKGTVNLITSSMNFSNNSFLNLGASDSATIWLSTGLSISNNGGFNNAGTPPQLTIWDSGTAPIDLSNNGNLKAALYAPNAALTFSNNANFYGSFIADSVILDNNAKVFYDHALGNLGTTPGSFALIMQWLVPSS